MAIYGIDDEHSQQLTTGIASIGEARKVARRLANDRGRSVWLYRDSEGAQAFESEEIVPTNTCQCGSPNIVQCLMHGPTE